MKRYDSTDPESPQAGPNPHADTLASGAVGYDWTHRCSQPAL